MCPLTLDGERLEIDDVVRVADAWRNPGVISVHLAAAARRRVVSCRNVVDRLVQRAAIVYGVTTGFGAFKNRAIGAEQAARLQENLLMSHAVGVGRPLPEQIIRAAMLIRANTLAKGYSGIRVETLTALLEMINRGVHPIVPEQGSVGASGDLAPLAHMALVLIGKGEASYRGQRMPGADAMRLAHLSPVVLQAKEGVALINGTSVMAAIGSIAVHRARQLLETADAVASLSLEALRGSLTPFDARLHAVRPHVGQTACADHMRELLEGSQLVRDKEDQVVQDAYTLRCIPQVHGAVRDVISHARGVVSIEVNSATDNPLIFQDPDDVALSGGNFHGEPIALAMDYLGLALTSLANMSERRIARLLDPATNENVLPPFLTEHGGVNSGFMMVQYTAAALASENKVLAHPASADSIPTSANVEDHVSMGASAARKAIQIIEHAETIIAIEALCAAQGIDLRRRCDSARCLGKGTTAVFSCLREKVPFIAEDQVMYPHIATVQEMVQSGKLADSALRALSGCS